MRNWKQLVLLLSAGTLVLALLALIVAIALSHFLIDLWWFLSLDFGAYFWLRLLYRYILSGGVTLGFFVLFFANFWVASRYLGIYARPKTKWQSRLLYRFQTGAMEVYTPLSLVMAVVLAIPFYRQWETGLLFFFGPTAGVQDSFYDNDVGFYLFRLPIFLLLQQKLLITFLVLLIAIFTLYWVEHQIVGEGKAPFPTGAKIHLTMLAVLSTLIQGWGFMLERFSLLYVNSHEPVFYGPGFVEMRYQLPLIWLSLCFFLGIAGSAIVYAHRRRGLAVGVAATICFLSVLGLRKFELIPALLEKYIVRANPVTTEGRFMHNNIEATLAAYNLNKVTTVDFKISRRPEQDITGQEVENYIANIPVWDEAFLLDVYQQLQGLRPYYQFSLVDVARYPIQGQVQQVNLAAREVNLAKLPREAAETWENKHLRYTHGYGVVMTPAAQEGERPMTWYIYDLTMDSPVGFHVDDPDIYYGQENLPYAIVPNRLEVTEIAGTPQTPEKYHGGGGIEIKSLFRKLIAAVYFQEPKIFFSINITDESRLRIRRNLRERIKELAPYLILDSDPYIVVTRERLYWIVDAYTTSRWYPVSKTTTMAEEWLDGVSEINYIRNSVKIVVDAYDGHVDFYIADPEDPIIRGFSRAYPGVFKPIAAMPLELQAQLRYPRDMFYLQMQIYAKYHQRQPELFYQQSETWSFARAGDVPKRPYYLTVKLEEHPNLQPFVQICPMTPIGRDNLSALALAGVRDLKEGPYRPELLVYRFGKEFQVEGPAQITALIDQNPEISASFTLWGQLGSEVRRGRIIVLPVGHSMLYVQPVYLISAGQTKIPQLMRVIVSMGGIVVMERTLKESFDRLRRLLEEKTRQEGRFPGLIGE